MNYLYWRFHFKREMLPLYKHVTRRSIKLSSPKLSNIIAAGCILVYAAVILLGMDYSTLPDSEQAFSIICTVNITHDTSVYFHVGNHLMRLRTPPTNTQKCHKWIANSSTVTAAWHRSVIFVRLYTRTLIRVNPHTLPLFIAIVLHTLNINARKRPTPNALVGKYVRAHTHICTRIWHNPVSVIPAQRMGKASRRRCAYFIPFITIITSACARWFPKSTDTCENN